MEAVAATSRTVAITEPTAARLLVRWEKKAENYLAMLHLACAQLIFGKLERAVGQRTVA